MAGRCQSCQSCHFSLISGCLEAISGVCFSIRGVAACEQVTKSGQRGLHRSSTVINSGNPFSFASLSFLALPLRLSWETLQHIHLCGQAECISGVLRRDCVGLCCGCKTVTGIHLKLLCNNSLRPCYRVFFVFFLSSECAERK